MLTSAVVVRVANHAVIFNRLIIHSGKLHDGITVGKCHRRHQRVFRLARIQPRMLHNDRHI